MYFQLSCLWLGGVAVWLTGSRVLFPSVLTSCQFCVDISIWSLSCFFFQNAFSISFSLFYLSSKQLFFFFCLFFVQQGITIGYDRIYATVFFSISYPAWVMLIITFSIFIQVEVIAQRLTNYSPQGGKQRNNYPLSFKQNES